MIIIAFVTATVMASAVAVVFTVVAVSVHGEDRHGELPHHAPTLIARGVRRLTGLRVCQPLDDFHHCASILERNSRTRALKTFGRSTFTT